MHDSRGAPLKIGDRVFIEAEVTQCSDSYANGYCNCSVKVVTPQQQQGGKDSRSPMDPPTLSAINTRMLTKIGACLLFSMLCGSLAAQTLSPKNPKIPQVDAAEVLRRGNMVVVAGEGPRGADEDAMKMATAPPQDESHMWFVTVIKTSNCQYCDKLHSDFQSAPELLAFIAAQAPYKAWGHFNEYNVNDETQKWRIKAYRITGYPTIVIQPPRNGMWGNPRTVVYQATGYDGNPKKLATAITNGVRKYAAVMSKQGYPKIQDLEFSEGPPFGTETKALSQNLWGSSQNLWGSLTDSKGMDRTPSLVVPANSFPVVVGGARSQDSQEEPVPATQVHRIGQYTPEPTAPPPVEIYNTPAGAKQYGVNPPFATPPRVDPFNPMGPNLPAPIPANPAQWPPTDQPSPAVPPLSGLFSLALQAFGSLLSGQGMGNFMLLLVLITQVLMIVAPTTPTQLDDKALTMLKELLALLKGGGNNPPGPTTPSQPA